MSKEVKKNLEQACYDLSVGSAHAALTYLIATAIKNKNKQAEQHFMNTQAELKKGLESLNIHGIGIDE